MLVLQDFYFCRSFNWREQGTLANQQKDQKDIMKSEVNVTFVFFKTARLEEKILTLFLIAASERWMINYLCGRNIT